MLPGGQEPKGEVKRVAFSKDGANLAGAGAHSVAVYRGFNSGNVNVSGPIIPCDRTTECCFDVAWGTDPNTGQNLLISGGHYRRIQVWYEQSA